MQTASGAAQGLCSRVGLVLHGSDGFARLGLDILTCRPAVAASNKGGYGGFTGRLMARPHRGMSHIL